MWHKLHGCVKRSLRCVRWVRSYSVRGGKKQNKAKGAGDAADVEESVVCRVPTLLSVRERWCDEFGVGRPWGMCCQIRSNTSGHVFRLCAAVGRWGVTLRWTTSTHVKWNAHWGSKHHAALWDFFFVVWKYRQNAFFFVAYFKISVHYELKNLCETKKDKLKMGKCISRLALNLFLSLIGRSVWSDWNPTLCSLLRGFHGFEIK